MRTNRIFSTPIFLVFYQGKSAPCHIAFARAMRGRVAVVVLGDVGRSPRMQYHALSLADQVPDDATCPHTAEMGPDLSVWFGLSTDRWIRIREQ